MSNNNRQQFAETVRKLREESGLTLRELGNRSNVSFTAISAIEHGRAIAGMTTASKLAEGLKLEGEVRDGFLLAASISSRKTNPSQGNGTPVTPFLRALPWILRKIGQAFEKIDEVSICNLSELPDGQSDLVVLFEHKNLNPYITSKHVLKPEVREFLQKTSKRALAVLVRSDRSQTVISFESTTFA